MAAWALGCVLVSGAAVAARGGPGAPLEFYVASPLSEVRPGQVPKDAALAAELTAARGEREGFLVVLRGAGMTASVKARVDELRGDTGALPPSRVRLWKAAWIDVDGRQVPDALVPLDRDVRDVVGAARVKKGQDLPLYVEVDVPRGTAPGEYRGTLTVEAEDGTAQVPLAVTVLPVELPVKASLRTAFGFSAREALLSGGAAQGPELLASLSRSYALEGLAHRITLLGGSGVAPSFHKKPGEGDLTLDFTAFDDEVGALMDGVPDLDGAALTAIMLRVPSGLHGVERFKYVMAFTQHLRQKGWADRLVSFDEAGLTDTSVPKSCAFGDCVSGSFGADRWWRLSRSGDGGLGLLSPRAGIRHLGWRAFSGGAAGLRYDDAVAGFGEALWNGSAPQGALFYPLRQGAPGGAAVVESLRLKVLRDGLEDYELLKLARAAGHQAVASQWLTALSGEDVPPGRYDEARRAISLALTEPPPAAPKRHHRKQKAPVLPVPTDRACADPADPNTTVPCPR